MKYGTYYDSRLKTDQEKQDQAAVSDIPWKTVQKPGGRQQTGYTLHSEGSTQTDTQSPAQEQTEVQQAEQSVALDYNQQLDSLYQQIMNRPKFTFDVNEDALYQQLRESYIANGQLAMMDTMGQAAALTGGYGNSYAQGVGQQAYQQYLQGLTDEIPDLYNMALNQYIAEGDAMYDQLAALQWQAEFDEDKRRYDQAWEQEYGTGSDTSSGSSGGSTGGSGYSSETAKIQQELVDAGYNIAVDGVWGPETQKAYDDYNGKDGSSGGNVNQLSDAAQAFINSLPYPGNNAAGWKEYVLNKLKSSGLSDADKEAIAYRLGL